MYLEQRVMEQSRGVRHVDGSYKDTAHQVQLYEMISSLRRLNAATLIPSSHPPLYSLCRIYLLNTSSS